MASEEVQENLNEKIKTINEIGILNKQITAKEESLTKVKIWLLENCKHIWEYQRESSWDEPDYICNICGFCQSDQTKLKK